MANSTQPPLRDANEVREIFADDFLGLTVIGENFKLTFISLQADHAKDPVGHYRQISARLVLPANAAASLRDSLTQALGEMRAKSLFQASRTRPDQLQ
jgi:hypothetical protein